MTLGVYCNILVNLQNLIERRFVSPQLLISFRKKKKMSILMQLENIFILSLSIFFNQSSMNPTPLFFPNSINHVSIHTHTHTHLPQSVLPIFP